MICCFINKTMNKFYDDLIREFKSLPNKAHSLFEEDRDSILEFIKSEQFFDCLFENKIIKNIDIEIFFYALLIHINENREQFNLDDNKIKHTRTLEYLASTLKQFLHSNDIYNLPVKDDNKQYKYIFEMIKACQNISDQERFFVFCHIGNFSLYKTTIKAENTQYRTEFKDRPIGEEEYENYARTYYKKASDHKTAKQMNLEEPLYQLSNDYKKLSKLVKQTLNELEFEN